MSEILQKWSALKKSEQLMLTYGVFVILIAFLYFYVWTPYTKAIINFEENVVRTQEDIIWLNNISAQVKQLKSGTTAAAGSFSGSLINTVDKSIKKNKLNKKVSLLEKSGADKVVIQFSKMPFDELIKLLAYLKTRYGIVVNHIDIKRSDDNKLVNTRVILKKD